MLVFWKGLIRHTTDEKIYKFSKVWIADIALRRIWLASSISLVSSSVEPPTGFNFFFICSALRAWASLSCWRSLSTSGSWLSSCWAWIKATSTCLSSASKASLFADKSEIFYFSSTPVDCKVPMLLCFSSAAHFTCSISSLTWAWAALLTRRWMAFWYWSWRLSKWAAWKSISSASAGIWPRRPLKIILAGLESSTSWAVSYCNRASKSSSLDLISADAIPSAIEELASSPSSSEMSMAKENRLSGESCSWKQEKMN